MFDKSYSSEVMGTKAQQEWGEVRLGGQEKEETKCFAKRGSRELSSIWRGMWG